MLLLLLASFALGVGSGSFWGYRAFYRPPTSPHPYTLEAKDIQFLDRQRVKWRERKATLKAGKVERAIWEAKLLYLRGYAVLSIEEEKPE